VTVDSSAARKPRRSAAGKAGTTGSKTGTTGTKSGATGTRRTTRAAAQQGTEPQLVQLLTPEGKRVKNAEYDAYVAGITPEDLRGLYRDMVLTRRFDAEGPICGSLCL
jgi:pyruvate dehydrogenase E1 component alpha subunit